MRATLIYLLLTRWVFFFFPYSLFIKLCLSHISTVTTHSFIRRLHHSDNLYLFFFFIQWVLTIKRAKHLQQYSYDWSERNNLSVSRYRLLCVVKYPHVYNKQFYGGTLPLRCFCNQKVVYHPINSRPQNIMQLLKCNTSDTFLMGWYLYTISRAGVLSH